MVQYVGDHAKDYKLTYGNIAPQSVGAIQRALLRLEDEGGNIFFGGDATNKQGTVVWAVKQGKLASQSISNFLQSKE